MPRYTPAKWEPIPPQLELEQSTRSERVKTQLILHSAQGTYPGSVNWWKTQYNFRIYSTFFVRRSGQVVQFVDSSYFAPANSTANGRAISVETDDNTKPDSNPWNDKQLDALVNLIRWASETHGIPLRPCSAHDQPGIGFHTMFGNRHSNSPWIGENKEDWAKTCPGLIRIEQFYKEILPTLGYSPAQDEDDIVFARWQPPPRRANTQPRTPARVSSSNRTLRAAVGDWNSSGAFGQPKVVAREEQPFTRRIKLV